MLYATQINTTLKVCQKQTKPAMVSRSIKNG